MPFPSTRFVSCRVCAVLIGMAVLSLVLPLAASEDEERVHVAKNHYANGEQSFKEGRYAEALREFEAGYEAIPRPAFLLNMGHCQRRLGDPREAHELYRLFLEAEPQSPLRGEVEGVMAQLQEEIAAKPAPPPRLAWAAPAPAPAPASPAVNLTSPAPPRSAPLYKRWQTWAVAAGVVAAGAATFLLLHNQEPSYSAHGSLGTLGAP